MLAPASLLLAQLRNAKYSELEQQFTEWQKQFEQGDLAEQDLFLAFSAFEQSATDLGEKLSEWVSAYPESYAAHTAFSKWFLHRAWDLRGGATYNLVSDQGRRGMAYFLEQSEGAARYAVSLSENPLMAWATVGYVGNTHGNNLSQQDVDSQHYPDWFAEAIKANPYSFLIRRIMLFHLRAEWGGSENHMLSFVRQQQDSGMLSQNDMQRLWADFHACMSHYHMVFTKDSVQAIERATVAADLHELKAEQLLIALTEAKKPIVEKREALRRYLAAAEKEPNARPSGNFSWVLNENGKWLESELPAISAYYQRLIDSGDNEAMTTLGALQAQYPSWKLPDLLPSLRQAREQGNGQAAEIIVFLQDNHIKTVRL